MNETEIQAAVAHFEALLRSQLARQIRVLGIVFKAAAAEGRTLGVQARPQQDVYLLSRGVRACAGAHGLGGFRVPAVGQGSGGGNAGCLGGGVQPQVIALARLLAQAAGAVRQRHCRDAKPVNRPGMPHVLAGQQRDRDPVQGYESLREAKETLLRGELATMRAFYRMETLEMGRLKKNR